VTIDEQLTEIRGMITEVLERTKNVEVILLRAFTSGLVRTEQIVNSVRSLYDVKYAARPDSKEPVPGNEPVSQTPTTGDVQAGGEKAEVGNGDSGVAGGTETGDAGKDEGQTDG
jgi:hypothetical protein